ncbi:hypothetical protein MTQ00_02715 [Chryseobacterium sp. B21-037]|uniref:hypothetical protein n=1 Tax=Chryseobacterium sp. B21-037 TaxID=2926038 RepID=UPI002358B493|nr:hypothetical protein [Chryseobacterium sp. B21-037]MDC8103441.1 hypothetical protein [Chryseobacterium sp. B21-037]
MNLKSYLELKIIYVDEELIELKIKGSGTYFSGSTDVYANIESINLFAEQLTDFPKNEKSISFELGVKDSKYSYFSINLYPAHSLSHIGIQIKMATEAELRIKAQSKIQFEILAEPNAIDEFRKALNQITIKKSGAAILYGMDNRLS